MCVFRIFQREHFENGRISAATHVFRREPVSLFRGRKASESLFAITPARESFPPSGDGGSASRFALPKSARLEMDDCDCDCARDEPVGIGFRASFPPQLSGSRNSPRSSRNSNPPASLSPRSVHPTTYRLALSQVFFHARNRVSSTRRENIFRNG